MTVFNIKSNSWFRLSQSKANGTLISEIMSLMIASAPSGNFAIFLPHFLKVRRNRLAISENVICFLFRVSFIRSLKCFVNSTSIFNAAKRRSAKTSKFFKSSDVILSLINNEFRWIFHLPFGNRCATGFVFPDDCRRSH